MTFFIIKKIMHNHVIVYDENNCALYYTLEVLKISNYQLLTMAS